MTLNPFRSWFGVKPMSEPASPPAPAAPPNPPAEPAAPPAAPPPADNTKAALAAENELLKARLQREAVKAAAVPHGIVDTKLLDYLPIDGTSIGKDGSVQGVEAAVTKLRADHPAIFGSKPAAAPAPAAPAPTPSAPVPPVHSVTPVAPVPPPPAPGAPSTRREVSSEEWRKNKEALIAAVRPKG